MKRILFILTLALVALAGCKKEPAPGPEPGLTPDTPTTIVFKTSKAVGETITLGFNGSEIQNISIDGAKAEDVTVNHSWRIFKLKLTSQTVTVKGDITVFDCRNNGITEIALTKDLRLYDFNCNDNDLTSLDVSGLTELEYLSCVSNKLTSLDVSGLEKLEILACSSNKLTSLNIEGCESLYYVECYRNSIKDEAMTDIVNDLPTLGAPGAGRLVVTAEGCGNVITEDDIDIAARKNWDVMDDKYHSISQRTTFTSPANCYIVTKAGKYTFKAVKGNSSESVGRVASAEVLWETFGTHKAPEVGDLVKEVSYNNGEITFKATDKKGNAVVAAKDAAGNILWSWHIWLTDQPVEHVYKNNAGTMMDRNLGATSVTSGDVRTIGLLYQWGRKDPFLGAVSFNFDIPAKSTITWPSALDKSSSTGNIAYAIAHPTTFISIENITESCDWTDMETESRWTTSDRTKSIYDPCPAGWRVPDGGEDGVWTKAGFFDNNYIGIANKEAMFYISTSTTAYPLAGYRVYDGDLKDVSTEAHYWSAYHISDGAYTLEIDIDTEIRESGIVGACGLSVRCVKE